MSEHSEEYRLGSTGKDHEDHTVQVNINRTDQIVRIYGSVNKLTNKSKSITFLQDRRASTGSQIAFQNVNKGVKIQRFLPERSRDPWKEILGAGDSAKGELRSFVMYSKDARKFSTDASSIRLERYQRGSQFGRENLGFENENNVYHTHVISKKIDENFNSKGDDFDNGKTSTDNENDVLNDDKNLKVRNPPTAQVSPTIKQKRNNDFTSAEEVSVTISPVNEQVVDIENVSAQTKAGNESNGTNPNEDEEMKWLQYMETQFIKIAGDDGEISLEEFKDALKLRKSFFAERFFFLFDKDDSGSIECHELMDGLRMITKGSPAQKLKFLFDVYDVDGSGSIDREELRIVLRSCMEESSLSLGDDDLNALTDILFDAADVDESGTITFEELEAELKKHPGVIENLTISAAQWLKPPTKTKKKTGCARYLTWNYIRNNLRKVLFIVWYILMNLGLGGYAAWNYRESNPFVIAARICGMNLNFNCMFVLVLMLRKCLTYLRMVKIIALILPLDQNILFHKMVGIMIAVYSAIHTLTHIGNAVMKDMSDGNITTLEILFTTKAGIGWVGSSAYITGWALLLILIVMIVCSMPFVRRGGHFQVFYLTHMLYVPFWILVILHGPSFWKWFVAPGVLFLGEKFFRSKLMKLARYGKTYIEEVNLLPSGVCHLAISKPENFRYQPGDYIFLQIPNIAQHEWHPFTISSAPEMQGHIWVHIRSAGHWTNKLYEYFSNLDPKNLGRKSIQLQPRRKTLSPNLVRVEGKGSRKIKFPVDKMALAMEKRIAQKHKAVKIRCYVDGPYGTATREIFETEHAVLVGAGIGVTPMASILQSVMYRYKESKRTCPQCKHEFYGNIPESTMKLKKVDFIWINRDQKSFEWFVSLLSKLEAEQIDVTHDPEVEPAKVIDIHLYMTAAQSKTDMKGIGLQVALDLLHQKENKDLITGLKTRTQAGRPNWNEIFTTISKEKKGKVKVFFCGAPALGKTIKESCMKFNFSFSKENF